MASGQQTLQLGSARSVVRVINGVVYIYDDAAAIEAQFGDTHPLSSSKGVPGVGGGGFAGDVLTYGIGGSYQFVQHESTRVAGVLELVGWNVQGGMVTPPASTDGVSVP